MKTFIFRYENFSPVSVNYSMSEEDNELGDDYDNDFEEGWDEDFDDDENE